MNKNILSLSKEELNDICKKYLSSSNKKCNCPLFIDGKCAKEYLDKLNKEIDIDFDINLLTEKFKARFNLELTLSKDEIKELSRIAMLFNKSELSLARLLYMSISKKTVDLKKLYILCEKEVAYLPKEKNEDEEEKAYTSEFGKKINLMNKISPVKYLSILSNHHKLADSDIAIINDLSLKYGLTKGVINVIIEYTLSRLDGDFPRAYCEKIASFLSRHNVNNAMQAINVLNEYFDKIQKHKEI